MPSAIFLSGAKLLSANSESLQICVSRLLATSSTGHTTIMAKAKAAAPSSSGGGKSAKKKKWSKGKVKDKAAHAVSLDKATFDRIMKEVPTFRFISQSILIERLKVNGSLARRAIRHLEKEGLIKRIVHHSGQLIYTRLTTSSD
ncbi:hypothetical protein JAAARDRAFT_28716 [Jaapia argillacea MUCL 33604]|uniref:40S ribosomal protein S25 n=1 Tax=Jaapia argillacea MUCL 33604 TaxID=933084 RepID=A0A067QDN9_9AGAM|nr:hypothetical protein JAAARDRAFT_28716 [Jaapia argillacea MUCL 33604]